MGMTLQDYRDYPRGYMDLDEQELPNSLIDVWVREGFNRIVLADPRWPFYEVVSTFTTVQGQAEYVLTDIVGNLRSPVAFVGEHHPLTWLGASEAEHRFPSSLIGEGRPVYFTLWANTVKLYPTPSAAYTITVRGYRNPIDWIAQGAGAEPDMPEELHDVLASYVLAKAYFQQEDPELGAANMAMFDSALQQYRSRLNDTPGFQPMILNGRHQSERAPGRRPYPWE